MRCPIGEVSVESPLKQMRKRVGLCQTVVANLAGISQAHVSYVENGLTMPGPKLSRLLAAIDILDEQKQFIRMTQLQLRLQWQRQVAASRGGGDIRAIPNSDESGEEALH